MRITTILPLAFAASFSAALVLQSGPDLGHVPWAVSRASGIASFVVLSGSVLLGLLLSTRAAESAIPRPLAFDLHKFLSVVALTLIGLHAGALMFDSFLAFTPAAVLVPFVSPYRPFWVALGVVGAWVTAAVAGSFWMRRRIGRKAWRTLHHASFGTYILGLLHGMGAGTDTQLPWVYWMYVLSAALVFSLTAYRVLQARARATRRPPGVHHTASRAGVMMNA